MAKATITPSAHAEQVKHWLTQPFFWIALVVIAFVVGQNMHPADSQASIAPSPQIVVPAPVVAPAPLPVATPAPSERIVYLQQPAPQPITNNNIIMVGANEPGKVLKEIPAVMQIPYTPTPTPTTPTPKLDEPSTVQSSFVNDDCTSKMQQHLNRVAAWRKRME